MLKNYLTIALRNLRKHKGYAAINVAGLAIGLACFALILLYVQDEFRYDDHNPNAERIVRVAVETEAGEGLQRTAQSPPIWPTLMLDEYPEVRAAVRFKPPRQTWMVRHDDEEFAEKGWAFADSSVFDIFHVPLVRGNPETALSTPFTVVVSESMVEKYFDGENPIGRMLSLDNQYDFEVAGVMADMPRTSHFHFDFLASFVSLEDPEQLYLFNALEGQFPFSYTYLLLEDGTTESFAQKLPAFLDRHLPDQFRQGGTEMRAFLQPLTNIHLHSHLENEIEPNGDAGTVYVFLAVGLFVLLIACVNFMNLATARSANRAKEVGMRKVVGAHRRHLVAQFLGESALLALLALAVALVLVLLALPAFAMLSGKPLTAPAVLRPGFAGLMVTVTLGVGLLAGSYPAFFLSSFRPAAVLRGALRAGTSGASRLRKGLIIFQFGISLVLIISTLIVYQQMDYARTKKLGFDKEHVVVLQVTDPNAADQYPAYRDAILQDPNVLNVSASLSTPGGLQNQATVRPEGAPEEATYQVYTYFSDFHFAETLGLEVVAGRSLDPAFSTDSTQAILINETAARTFGWTPEEALGKEILFGTNPQGPRVVGVVNDFHSQSVREQITPTVIAFNNFVFFAFVRIQPDDVPGTLASLRDTWERAVPGYVFDYSFLDEDFDELYQREDVLGTLLGYFAGLTIFIACLGLFGLASFMAEQRTQEIGVRKVLGASVAGIVLLLSKEFTKLVAAAFVVAAPVAYLAMRQWLSGFAYHTTVGVGTFLVAGAAALIIAWLTVSYQATRAALANPVEALRTE